MKKISLCLLLVCIVFMVGCASTKRNAGMMAKYRVPESEADWIRDGEPIKFEEMLWYPEDRFDVLLDSEVYYVEDYRGVPFFVQKIDVKPYNYMYTKFGRNKFRVYLKK